MWIMFFRQPGAAVRATGPGWIRRSPGERRPEGRVRCSSPGAPPVVRASGGADRRRPTPPPCSASVGPAHPCRRRAPSPGSRRAGRYRPPGPDGAGPDRRSPARLLLRSTGNRAGAGCAARSKNGANSLPSSVRGMGFPVIGGSGRRRRGAVDVLRGRPGARHRGASASPPPERRRAVRHRSARPCSSGGDRSRPGSRAPRAGSSSVTARRASSHGSTVSRPCAWPCPTPVRALVPAPVQDPHGLRARPGASAGLADVSPQVKGVLPKMTTVTGAAFADCPAVRFTSIEALDAQGEHGHHERSRS